MSHSITVLSFSCSVVWAFRGCAERTVSPETKPTTLTACPASCFSLSCSHNLLSIFLFNCSEHEGQRQGKSPYRNLWRCRLRESSKYHWLRQSVCVCILAFRIFLFLLVPCPFVGLLRSVHYKSKFSPKYRTP